MKKDLVAIATIKIQASLSTVWDALINPVLIKQYMFGTTVVSDWKDGSPIVWKSDWKGKPYEDKGTILIMAHEKMLQYTHFSPMEGVDDVPENYHTVSIELFPEEDAVLISLMQDNNATEKEKEASQNNWKMILVAMKKVLEG